MAQGTPIVHCQRLGLIAVLGLGVCLVLSLVHCLFAPGTSLEVFAILALRDHMGSEARHLNGLLALTQHEHGAGVVEMDVPEILVGELGIPFLTVGALVL